MDIIQEEFKEQSIVYGNSIVLYTPATAQNVVKACLRHNKEVYRLEAFLIQECGGIQPFMEFSRTYENISAQAAAQQALDFLAEMSDQPYLFEVMYM